MLLTNREPAWNITAALSFVQKNIRQNRPCPPSGLQLHKLSYIKSSQLLSLLTTASPSTSIIYKMFHFFGGYFL